MSTETNPLSGRATGVPGANTTAVHHWPATSGATAASAIAGTTRAARRAALLVHRAAEPARERGDDHGGGQRLAGHVPRAPRRILDVPRHREQRCGLRKQHRQHVANGKGRESVARAHGDPPHDAQHHGEEDHVRCERPQPAPKLRRRARPTDQSQQPRGVEQHLYRYQDERGAQGDQRSASRLKSAHAVF